MNAQVSVQLIAPHHTGLNQVGTGRTALCSAMICGLSECNDMSREASMRKTSASTQGVHRSWLLPAV
jgi:hypothetical protein